MPSPAILPPEIWCIIYEWAILSSISIHEHCTYINFPDAILHLRSPQSHPSMSRVWLRNLRLVCRASKALLDSTPQLALSMSEKAVYIEPSDDFQVNILLLLSECMRCRRIVVLNLPASESSDFTAAMLFDLLCENAHSLPALRSLTIGLTVHYRRVPETPRFWARLNEAFPDLECLVARGQLNTTWESSTIILEKLKVIDMDFLFADIQVQLPSLRHAAFGAMNYFKAANFTGCQHLESLLLRSIADPEQFDWNFVPKLRLLGLPMGNVSYIAPLPPGHPLHHIYLYFDAAPKSENGNLYWRLEEWPWLTLLMERFPTISRITMAFEPIKSDIADSIWGDVDDYELRHLGFTADYVSSGRPGGGRCIIMERIQIRDTVNPAIEASPVSQAPPQVEVVSKNTVLQTGLKALRRLSSFRLGD